MNVPMKDPESSIKSSYYVRQDQDDPNYERTKKILDAKYDPADIRRYVEESTHLSKSEQTELQSLLKKYEDLFDGTLGRWTGAPYDIELAKDAKP